MNGVVIDIQERAKKIKLLLLDVDGVLTDGKIVIGTGGEAKNFDVKDGLGITLLRRAGIHCVIITAKSSKVVRTRAKHLSIERIYENHYKIESLDDIKRRFNIKEEEICFVGDDLIDIPILKRVGFSVTLPNAIEEAKNVAHYITRHPGGGGAVREVCEIILKAQDKWEDVTKRYFE